MIPSSPSSIFPAETSTPNTVSTAPLYDTITTNDAFHACFRLQSCDACLSSPHPCSWCATSQVCVPNTHTRYPFAILAPIAHSDICPLAWRERWEMRAKPFSCRCSSMTLISVVVAVVSTLAGVLLLYLMIVLAKWLRRKWKARQADWWEMRVRRWRPRTGLFAGWVGKGSRLKARVGQDEETRPLLHAT